MKHFFSRWYVIAVVGFLLLPSAVLAAQGTSSENDICLTTMDPNALTVTTIARVAPMVQAGQAVTVQAVLENHTAIPFRNTQLLLKVTRTVFDGMGREVGEIDNQLTDIILLPTHYDIEGNARLPLQLSWVTPAHLASGQYRLDLFVVQNGIHVLGDYARNIRTASPFFVNVQGAVPPSPLRFKWQRTTIAGNFCGDFDMCVLGDKERSPAELSIENDAEKTINTVVKWKVYDYGMFGNDALLLSTSSPVSIKGHASAKVAFPFPDVVRSRYQGIAEIDDGGQRMFLTMRVGRYAPALPSIYTFGIAPQDALDTNTVTPLSFKMEQGKSYRAYVCMIGSVQPATTTLSLAIRNTDGSPLFMKEETRKLAPEISSFVYSFIAPTTTERAFMSARVTVGSLVSAHQWTLETPQSANSPQRPSSSQNNNDQRDLMIAGALLIIVSLFAFRFEYIRHTTHHESKK
jgi:hypothetical protein